MLHRKIVVDKGRCEIVCFSQIRAFPALFGIKSAHRQGCESPCRTVWMYSCSAALSTSGRAVTHCPIDPTRLQSE